MLLGLMLCGCKQEAPPAESPATNPQPESPTSKPQLGSSTMVELPFDAEASDVLVDDIDGDGRWDLAFTSHGENFTQVFFQRELRRFEAGPPIAAVGFHPGNLVKLPPSERPAYLMSGEGNGKLFTMEYAQDSGGLAVVAEARVMAPRYASTFRWPDWGLGIVVTPYSPPSVLLLKNYDPFTVKASQLVNLKVQGAFPLQSVMVTDLNGDGIDEIVLPLQDAGLLQVIRYPGPNGEPKLETLWDAPRLGPVKHVVAADINGDGLQDLVAPQESPSTYGEDTAIINVLLNNGQNGFSLKKLPFIASSGSENSMPGIRALDTAIDHDGLRYILAAGYDAYILYQLLPSLDLVEVPSRTLPYGVREGNFKVVLWDLDGDSWLDAVVARGRATNAGFVIFGPLWEHFTSSNNKPEHGS